MLDSSTQAKQTRGFFELVVVVMFLVVVVKTNLQKAELQSECSLQAESSV